MMLCRNRTLLTNLYNTTAVDKELAPNSAKTADAKKSLVSLRKLLAAPEPTPPAPPIAPEG